MWLLAVLTGTLLLSGSGPWGRVIGVSGEANQCPDYPTGSPSPINHPGDGAMHCIYNLNKVFMEDFIGTKNLSLLLSDDDGGSIAEKVTTKDIVLLFLPYTILLGIGLLFVILVPICGCFFCFCRTCGCCCKGKPGKGSRVKRTVCGGCFSIFLVFLILGVIFAMVSASFVAAQLKPEGLPESLRQSAVRIDNFVDNTGNDLTTLQTATIDPSLTKIREGIEDIPENVHHDLGETTNAVPLFNELEDYTKGIGDAVGYFDQMDSLGSTLQTNSSLLNTSVEDFKTKVLSEVTKCLSESACKAIKTNIENLRVTADFTGLSSTQPALDAMNISLNVELNITFSVNVGTQIWDGIGELLTNSSEDTIQDMSDQIDDLSSELNQALDDAADIIKSISTEDIIDGTVNDMERILDSYSGVVLLALLSLCAVPLLIAVCYVFGILFGLLGTHPGNGSSCCTRGKGACCLMCGVSFTFMLCWIVMLVVSVLFLVGALTHNQLCRPLMNPKDSEDIQYIADQILGSSGNGPRINITDVMERCEKNAALYEALQVEEVFPKYNISKFLDLSQYDFDSILDDLTDFNLTDENVILMNNITEIHLLELQKGYDPVDFTTYDSALVKDITSEELDTFAKELDTNAGKINDNRVRKPVQDLVLVLRQIYTDQVQPMEGGMEQLKTSTKKAHSFVESLNITTFIPDMKKAQAGLSNTGVQNAVRDSATKVYSVIEEFAKGLDSSVRCDIGRCQELSSGLTGILTATCVFFLNPINALWFGLGWCLIILVFPMLFVSVSLVDQYRVRKVGPVDVEMKEVKAHINRRGKGTNKISPRLKA